MFRSRFSLFLALLLIANALCLLSTSKRNERRTRRQASRIPYASLSTGAIPARLRNRILGRRPSSSSESSSRSGSDDSSTSSTSGGTAGSSSTGYGANPYGVGPSSNQYGSFGGYTQQNRQVGSNDGGVPMGHSTYPFGTSRYTSSQNFQTPYSNQIPPGSASHRDRISSSYQPQRVQQPVNPYPSYGVPGGYGGMAGYRGAPPYGAYGANPYAGYGMIGGVVPQPQVPYANPYGLGQGGYYGGGYTGSSGYADTSGRTTIGSPYRDPNSRFTSWVHPQGETSNTNGAGGYSYGRTGSQGGSRYGSSSYGGTSDRYGSSGSRGRYSQSNPFGSTSSQGRYTQQHSYGSPTSSSRYSQTGNSRPYGGVSSSRGYNNADSSTGGYGSSSSFGGSQSAPDSGSTYTSGGSRGFGAGTSPYQSSNEADTYGSNSARGYGGTSGAYGTNSDQYSNSEPYGGVENQYSQTSGSRYGSTSGSRYGFGQSRDDQQDGSNGQSSQSVGGAHGSAERTTDRQSGQYYVAEPPGASVSGSFSSSEYHSNNGAGGISSSLGTAGEPSRTTGRFFNPNSRSSQPQADQTGRFFGSGGVVGSSQGTIAPGSAAPSGPNSNEESASVTSDEAREEVSRENYNNQDGTFLIPRRRQNLHVTGGENRTRGGQGRRKMHSSLRKCQILDDGLPDLYLDYKRMRISVRMDQIPVSNLSCAMSKDADCLSKSAYGPNRILLRKLLRFNTIAHNIGTADFLPNIHRRDWIFHPCHQHWHSMKEFAHFHLIDEGGIVVGEGHKVSFCLQDSECSNPCKKRYDCKQHTQGISPGCRDTYEASYDCQWIDVTEVAQGTYTLRVTVNPIVDGVRAVPELSYTNNVVECSVTVGVRSAEAHKCWAK